MSSILLVLALMSFSGLEDNPALALFSAHWRICPDFLLRIGARSDKLVGPTSGGPLPLFLFSLLEKVQQERETKEKFFVGRRSAHRKKLRENRFSRLFRAPLLSIYLYNLTTSTTTTPINLS